MSTTFVVHPFEEESVSDQLTEWPTYDYTDWTFDLTASRREGSSPTLDLEVQSAPLAGDDALYDQQTTFTSLDSNTTLPFTEEKSVTFGADDRFFRLKQTVTGEWYYKVEATVTLFDPSQHKDKLADQWEHESDLAYTASQAEDDVVRRFRQTSTEVLHRARNRSWSATEQYPPRGTQVLQIHPLEGAGEAIREAIARRIDWLYRMEQLEQNRDQNDHIRMERHRRDEWKRVDDALHDFDAREELWML